MPDKTISELDERGLTTVVTRTYRPGFLCLPFARDLEAPSTISGWTNIRTATHHVFVHPDAVHRSIVDSENRTAIVIGDIFVAHGKNTLEQALLRVASGDRSVLEDLSGKFAILTFDGSSGSVVNDPLGSQPIFYTLGPDPVVSSHSALIAETVGLSKSPVVKDYMASDDYMARTTRFLPGDLSLYKDVHLLVPNNALSLKDGTTARYWPRNDASVGNYETVLAVWDEYFTAYANYLTPRYRPVLGLTGGADSRAIIATLHQKQLPMSFQTWDKMPEAEKQRIPAMAAHLGGTHQWIDMTRRSDEPGFRAVREASKSAAGFTRGTPLLPAQMAEGTNPRDLFVYGHGPGVTAAAFNRENKAWLPEDPTERAYTLYAGNVRHDASAEYRKFTTQAIEGFFERGNYAADLHGTDIGDLIYWEMRMGNWASQQMATVAVGMPVHAAVNSRRLFHAFWGAPLEERVGKTLQRRIMAHYDPVLAEL